MNKLPETSAERLKSVREAAGYRTASAAAKDIGISYQTYASHESGGRGINTSHMQTYAAFFNVSVEWLLTGKGYVGTPPRASLPKPARVAMDAIERAFQDEGLLYFDTEERKVMSEALELLRRVAGPENGELAKTASRIIDRLGPV